MSTPTLGARHDALVELARRYFPPAPDSEPEDFEALVRDLVEYARYFDGKLRELGENRYRRVILICGFLWSGGFHAGAAIKEEHEDYALFDDMYKLGVAQGRAARAVSEGGDSWAS